MSVNERVLLVSALYPPNVVGGAEVVVRNLAEGLARRGHEVCVATLARRGTASDRTAGGVAVREFEMRGRHWPFSGPKADPPRRLLWHAVDNFDPTFYRRMRRLAQEFAPTIVNTHNINGFTPAVWLAARHAGAAPIVHTCHDYGLICSRTTMFAHGRSCDSSCAACRVLTSGKRYLTRYVDGVVGVSQAVLAPHLERRLFAHHRAARVIHNGQAVAEVPSLSRPSAGAGPLRVGFMGRLSLEKGIALLYEELGRLGGGLELRVAGRGDTGLVDRLAAEHRVPTKLLGFVAPKVFYENVDVLVVPSLWQDPLPTVVLEAYGHGVPVVVSDRGGLPELVRVGENGFVFDPGEPGALATVIRRLQGDRSLLRALGARALATGNAFTVEAMVDNYLTFYDEVRGRRPPRVGVAPSPSHGPGTGVPRPVLGKPSDRARASMRPWFLLVAPVLALAPAVPGAAFDSADLQRLRDSGHRSCRGCDLAGVDLGGMDLAEADLAEASLAGADLAGADLRGANLFQADLAGALLEGADLTRASLDRASLRGARAAGALLADASLDRADLAGADLGRATLEGASLALTGARAAVLAEARLAGANLFQADLRGADLRSADLRQASLAEANLDLANLASADLTGADLRAAKLSGVDLTGAVFTASAAEPGGACQPPPGAWHGCAGAGRSPAAP